MSDERHRAGVRERLHFLGYEVDDISASSEDEEVADPWAHQEDDRFVVEIKTRIEDEYLVERDVPRLSPDGDSGLRTL